MGSGGSEIDDRIVEAITCVSLDKDDDLDDEDPSDCREPGQQLTYTIYYTNDHDETLENAFIIDWLPQDVRYPEGDWTFGYDPNASPPIVLYPPDPGYDGATHSYAWALDTIDPNASGSVQLSIIVNDVAAPGTYLHNLAQLYGEFLITDPNDPNSLVTEVRLVTRASSIRRFAVYITPPQTLFVDETAVNSAQTGVDWPNAFLTLQDAIACAEAAVCGEVKSIYVAQGTYSGDSEDDSFDLTSLPGISLYGGFKTGGCPFEERGPDKYKTILTGRIDDTRRTDTVVVIGNNTLLSGFTITESAEYGVYGSQVDFVLEQCRIDGHDNYGVRAINGNVSLIWCNLTGNRWDSIRHDGNGYTLYLENCWIRQSGRYGVYCTTSTPIITNSIVSESDLTEAGNEGIRIVNPAYSPLLQNVTISHNKAIGVSLIGSTLPKYRTASFTTTTAEGHSL